MRPMCFAHRNFTTQSCLRFVGPDGRAAETAEHVHWGSVLTLLLAGIDMADWGHARSE